MSIEKTHRMQWLHYKNHYGSYKVPNKLPIEDIQNVSCRWKIAYKMSKEFR